MLVFKPFEKNLFGQTRSWAAAVTDGHYIIEKAPAGETYQPRFQSTAGKVEPMQGGAWLPSYDRAKQVCETAAAGRVRERISARARNPRSR
ncbi:MAG: hypothetical protein H0V44_05515 [Planctomycetes bacterium]|nr:hypothetical protein [Planctomycetota bacterium]